MYEKRSMQRAFLILIAFALVVPLALAFVASAQSTALAKKTDCYANANSGTVSAACDKNDATVWTGTYDSGQFPKDLTQNLTTNYSVDHVSVHWGITRGSGQLQVWTGSAWLAAANFTCGASGENQTVLLDSPKRTNALRLHVTVQTGCGSVFSLTVAELWPYGDVLGAACTTYFASNGIDQPQNWASQPSGIVSSGKTFVTYQGGSGYLPYVMSYDGSGWTGPIAAASSNPVAPDGHGAPAIVADGDGFLHIFYGAHISALKHVRSVAVEDIHSWATMADPEPTEATYPHVFLYSGALFLLYRHSVASSTWAFRTSSDDGTTWSAATDFMVSSGNAYLDNMEIRSGKLFFAFDVADVGGVRRGLYAAYLDLSSKHVFSISNVDFGVQMSQAEADANARIEARSATWIVHAGAIRTDSSGVPYIVYQSSPDAFSAINYNFTRWNGASWTASVTVYTTDSFTNNDADFIVNSPASLELYGIGSGKPGPGGDLEKWTWNGSSWTKVATILSEGTEGKPLATPMIPNGHTAQLKVVFAEHLTDATSPKERLLAYGDQGFVLGCPALPLACALNGAGISGLTGILAIVIGVGLLLLAVGAFLTMRAEKKMDVKIWVSAIVGFVVVILITSTLIGSLNC